MTEFLKRTWTEIDLSAIQRNYGVVREIAGPDVKVMAVVKADAYGHGVRYVAPALAEAGAEWFGVSNLEEAVQLRRMDIKNPVLILGYTPPKMADVIAEHDFSQTVFSLKYGMALSRCAKEKGVEIKTHIKIDTGMNRLGFGCQNEKQMQVSADEIRAVLFLGSLRPEGIFTHFASADFDGDKEGEFTRSQYDRFLSMTRLLEEMRLTFSLKHACNSAGVINYPDMCLDMVRPGIMLYGLNPGQEVTGKYPLKPALQLKTVVSMVKEIDKDMTVGYGRTFKAVRPMTLATVPIGYADGYPRILSPGASMLIAGRRAKVLGRVSMDQLVLDVTDIGNVSAGQTVTAIGRDGGAFIPVEEISSMVHTINYETVCLIGKRVPRVFYQDGEPIHKVTLTDE